ncbi:MAG TPA: helix-turn-helix transcriptional regulator [Bacteroidia bacterium]
MLNDWILSNIRRLIKQKNLKMSYVASRIGVSEGEFSKILNGYRINYYDKLPLLSEILEVDFHELVDNSNAILLHDEGQISFFTEQTIKQFELTINSKDVTIKALEELLSLEREIKETYIKKYQNLKIKFTELEKKKLS